MDVYDYFLTGSRERFELIKKEHLLVVFSMDVTLGKYGNLTKETNDALNRIGEEYELKLIDNGKRKGTIRADLDDKILLLFFQGVTEKFNMKIIEIAKNFEFEPTDELYREMENYLNNMVLLLKTGMGR